MLSSESYVCSPLPRLVRLCDQPIPLQDGVDASMADLDAFRFQVGFDGFTAPSLSHSNLDHFSDSFPGYPMDGVRCP